LPRVLKPLLVIRRLFPTLVGFAGTDQVDISAEVFAIRAAAVARTFAEAMIVGMK
jgi:hypothetical protein